MTDVVDDQDQGDELPPTVYADHVEFFDQALSVWFAQASDESARWCPQWRSHAEADAVVAALWESWEALKAQGPGTGMAVWWSHYAYPLMERVLAPTGTFARCYLDTHRDPTPLGENR